MKIKTNIVAATLLMGFAVSASPASADNETFDSFFRNSGYAPQVYVVSPTDALAQAPTQGSNFVVRGANSADKDEARWFAFQNRYGN